MKKYVLVTGLVLFSILSCTTKEKEAVESEAKTIVTDSIKKEIVTLTPKEEDFFELSFIGKKSDEVAGYFLHECSAFVVESDSVADKYFVSTYAKTIDDCRNGKNKIILGRFLDTSITKDIPYEIVDELNVVSENDKKMYSRVELSLPDDEQNGIYIAEFNDDRKPLITKIYRIWKVDIKKGKFIPVRKPQKLTFDNPDYVE